jgi:hypothetical protein
VLAVYLRDDDSEKRLESTVRTRCPEKQCVDSFERMDKKQINSPKMTLNFLIWVGGVFMLLLFAFLAHFVWRIL